MKSSGLDLREFKIPLGLLAPLEVYTNRRGETLSYRFYPALSENLIVLYHGIGADSRYMCVLASALVRKGIANVVTPDFRCHGESRGLSDEICENQLEIDLDELLIHLKMKKSLQRIFLSGHSMGGGFTLKVAACKPFACQFSGFVALAPYLPPEFQVEQPDYGGWIYFDREAGRVNVNMPSLFRTGEEKLSYSEKYHQAVAVPSDFLRRLPENVPLSLVCGEEDQVLRAARYPHIFAGTGVRIVLCPQLNHLTLMARPESYLSQYETQVSKLSCR